MESQEDLFGLLGEIVVRTGLISARYALVATLYLVLVDVSVAGNIEEVVQNWTEREASTHTLECRWNSALYQLRAEQRGTEPPEFREVGITYSAKEVFVIDSKGRARLEAANPQRFDADGVLSTDNVVEVFDTTRRTALYMQGSLDGYPVAHVSPDATPATRSHPASLPLRLIYRPFNEEYGILTHAALEGGVASQVPFQGDECILIEGDGFSVIVTEGNGNLPLRLTTTKSVQGQPVLATELSISYGTTQAGDWFPEKWVSMQFAKDGKTVSSSAEAVVESFSVNEELDDSMFAIDFPDGTVVRDHISGSDYIVREGKSDRELLPGELRPDNYDAIVSTEVPVRNNAWRGRLFLVANCVVAFVVGVLVVLRIRGRLRRSNAE